MFKSYSLPPPHYAVLITTHSETQATELCGIVNSGWGGVSLLCDWKSKARYNPIFCVRTPPVNDKWIWLDLTHSGTHLSSFKEIVSTKGISSLSVFPMISRCLSKFMMHWKQNRITGYCQWFHCVREPLPQAKGTNGLAEPIIPSRIGESADQETSSSHYPLIRKIKNLGFNHFHVV